MSKTAANSGRGWQPETIRHLLTANRLCSFLAVADRILSARWRCMNGT